MARITNLDRVKRMIQQHARSRERAMQEGLKDAGKVLLAASQLVVPVDYGHLKGSKYIESKNKGARFTVEVGYHAAYAIYVHENPWALHGEEFNRAYAKELAKHPTIGPFRHARGPNQIYKFLEWPFRKLRSALIQIVRERLKR